MKKELRTKLRSLMAAFPQERLQTQSLQAAELLFHQPEYQQAEIIMIYLSIRHEANTTPIVLQTWQDRKRVVAPQVSWSTWCFIARVATK